MADNEDFFDDVAEMDTLDIPPVGGPRSVTSTLPQMMIRLALTPEQINLLRRDRTTCMLIQAPSADWVEPLTKAAKLLGEWKFVHSAKQPDKSKSGPDITALQAIHALSNGGRTLGVSHNPSDQWAVAADEGFRAVRTGEASLRELLTKLNEAQTHTRGVWGPRDTYGYAYGLLQRTLDDPAYDRFRDAVRQFAIDTMPIKAGTDVLGQVLEKQVVHTVRTAAKASGAHDRTIRRVFERNGLGKDTLGSNLRNHRVTVSADDIERMVEQLKTAMTTPKVMEATGIPRMHLKAIVAARYLPTVTGSENEAHAKHRFAPSEVKALMDRLFAGAVTVTAPTPRQLPIMEARHAAVTSLETILALIFDGKLTWKGRLRGRTDYEALLIDADEITALVRTEPKMVHLTRTEAIDIIPGFSRFALDAFLASGHLETAMEFSPDARREVEVITKDSAMRFVESYVTLGELRQISGLHLKQVKLLLRGAGIETAFTPDTYKVCIYDRPAIERVVEERPDFWVYDKAKARAATRDVTS